MTREDRFLVEAHKVADIFLSGFAFVGAYLIKKYLLPGQFGGLIDVPNYKVVLLLIIIIWYAGFQYSGLHQLYGRLSADQRFFRLFKVVSINFVILALCFYLFRIRDVSRFLIAIFFVLDLALLSASNWLRLRLQRSERWSNVLIVIIGSKVAAKELVESVASGHDVRCRIIGCLDVKPDYVGNQVAEGVSVIGTIDQLESVLKRSVVDEVIFAMPIREVWQAERYMAIAEAVGVRIRVLLHWNIRKFLTARPKFYSMYFEEFFDHPTMVLTATTQKRGALLVKGIFDHVCAFVGIVCLLPVLLIIACAIRAASPGQILYTQERCGLYGRRFTVYKFRTMRPGADKVRSELAESNEMAGPAFKMKRDPRVIPFIGAFLRQTGLDELPQLYNVLRGEMSIIGPRPPLPDEVDKYELWERRRLSMKPGITCIWQVSPHRNRISFKDWMRMDLEYIDGWSLWLDLKILIKTVKAMILRYGM